MHGSYRPIVVLFFLRRRSVSSEFSMSAKIMFVIQPFLLEKYFNGELARFPPITVHRGWEAVLMHTKSSFSPEAEQPTKIVTLHLCDLRPSWCAVSSPAATKLREPAIRQKYAVSSTLIMFLGTYRSSRLSFCGNQSLSSVQSAPSPCKRRDLMPWRPR